MIRFTQGDDCTLQLTCVGRDLTGATFETKITDSSGTLGTYENAAHSIVADQVANVGRVNLALTAAQTVLLASGKNKNIITKVTISGAVTYYNGYEICEIRKKPT